MLSRETYFRGIVGLCLGLLAGLTLLAGTAGASERVGVKISTKSSITARVDLGEAPVRTSVWLNGRKLSRLFADRPRNAPAVQLSPGEGLRFGKNRFKVRVLWASGKATERNRTFTLTTRRPIPDVAGKRTIFGGQRVPLSAKKTKARGKGKVVYRWQVVGRPKGSKPRLLRPRSVRPVLVTDRGGVYRVRLAVRKGRAPARFVTAQIDASDPLMTRAGTFVATAPFGPGAADGPATSLRIFDGSSAGSYPVGQASRGPVVTLMFDRETMALAAGPFYTGVAAADAKNLQTSFATVQQSTGRTPLVVSAGNNFGTPSTQFLAWFRNTLNADGLAKGTSSFALAGVGTGSALSNGTPPPASMHFVNGDVYAKGRLSGQILPDASANWSFVPSTLPAFGTTGVQFDSAAGGDEIEIAGQTYPRDPQPAGCPAAAGFQVLAVAASAPNPMEPVSLQVNEDNRTFGNGDTFWTNACALGSNDASQESRVQQTAMHDLLGAINSYSQPLLVFVQSVGDVSPSDTTTNGNENFVIPLLQASDDIADLGGSTGTFLGLFGQSEATGYSLIGQNFNDYGGNQRIAKAEVATNMETDPPARLIGRMQYDPAGRLIPSISSAADGQRATVLKQDLPQTSLTRQIAPNWERTPFPNEGNPAWESALRYLAAQAGLSSNPDVNVFCSTPPGGKSDVRSNYCGGVPAGETPDSYWQTVVWPQVDSAPYVQNPNYTATDLAAVKTQLQIEFELVDDANEAANALAQSFSSQQSNDAKAITDTYVTTVQTAEQQAQLEARPTDLGWLSSIFDLAASVTGFFSDGLSGVLWVTSASLANESYLAADGSGNSVFTGLKGRLSGTPEEAAGSIAAQIANQVTVANQLRFALADTIASDWGRLQQADDDLNNVPDSEAIANSIDGGRYGAIDYVWNELLGSSTYLANLNDTSINDYNPTGNGVDPAYDLSYSKAYGCWLSGTGIFGGGESIEKVYGLVTAGNVYSDPHNILSWQQWNPETPWVLVAGGKNPSGSGSNPAPAPAAQNYAAFVPDALINPFTAPQLAAGSTLDPVVNGGPPGLGHDRDQFFDRLGMNTGAQVTCHGPGSL